MIAQVVGTGSATTKSSSLSTPAEASGMRVTVLPPWPMITIAFRLSFWDTCSLGSKVASNQRVDGMPGVLIIFTGLPSAPVLPRALCQAVVERQCYDIEPQIRGALHVGVAAEDVGPGAEFADIAGGKQGNAEGPHVGRADRVLGRTHAPDERGRLFRGEQFGDALELCARHAGHALDLIGRPLLDLFAHVVHAVDALLDEFLVLP